MLLFELKKPNIVWAFLFLFITSTSYAGFYEEQIHPVGIRAFDSTSQRILLTGVGSLWLAASQDSKARDEFKDHQKMSEENSRLGDEFGTYLVGPVIALGQIYFDHDNGISHARGLVYSTLVTHVLKETIRRQRPDGSNHQSMPSGHTSSAFTTATSLTYAYGWKTGIIAYPVATLVAVSRMSDDKHWLSDTVAGAFIGVWMARASFYSVSDLKSSTSPAVWTPIVNHEKVALLWEKEF